MSTVLTKLSTQGDNLENSFFQLSFDQLGDKLQKLIPYLIGFQIVKKNEDSTKAVGVFAFKSGKSLLYVPTFWINGNVKGIDLLYSKSNEQFYPLTEEMADLFLKEDSTRIGDKSNVDANDVRHEEQFDLGNMIVPPRTGRITTASVLDYVKEASNETKELFGEVLEKNADYLESLLRYNDLEKVADSLILTVSPKKEPLVKVITNIKEAKDLTSAEKTEFLSKGYYIKDSREKDQISQFNKVQYQEKFTSPLTNGFYQYVTQDGLLRYGLVIVRPSQLQQHFATDDSFVIDFDNDAPGQAYVVDATKLFVRDNVNFTKYDEVAKLLDEPAEVSPSFNDTYMLVNESLNATEPFTVIANFKDNDGVRRITVAPYTEYGYQHENDEKAITFQGVGHKGKLDLPGSVRQLPRGNYFTPPKKAKRLTLVLTKKTGNKLEFHGSNVYVPKGYKLLAIDLRDRSSSNLSVGPDKREEKASYNEGKPGAISSVLGALSANNLFPVSLNEHNEEITLAFKGKKEKYSTKEAATIGLVIHCGFDEKTAQETISQVSAGHPVEGYVKVSELGDSYHSIEDEVPYTNALGQPTYAGYPRIRTADRSGGYQKDPTRLGLGDYNGPSGTDDNTSLNQDIQKAVGLAQHGQKEIFDTQSIATLAKYVSPERKINDYMPALLSGLDRLGRLLFLLNWSVEEFEEMFGRDDLPELNELLTQTFKGLGDLIVFFKKHSPELTINSGKQ